MAVQDARNLPTYFRTVTLTLSNDPAKYFLYDVRQFKNKVVNRFTLDGYTVYLQSVKCSSVKITLAYPQETHAQLLKTFDAQFKKSHNPVYHRGGKHADGKSLRQKCEAQMENRRPGTGPSASRSQGYQRSRQGGRKVSPSRSMSHTCSVTHTYSKVSNI